MYVFGAGNFGREVRDAILEGDGDVSAYLTDVTPKRAVPVPVLRFNGSPAPDDSLIVVAVADTAGRADIVRRLKECGWRFGTVVHPRASLGGGVSLGEGSVVLALSYLSTDARLANHVQITYGVTFGHDSVAEDFVTVLPNSTIGGEVHIGSGATIGSGAVVLPGLTIGEGSIVGAGAVVTKDVPPRTVVVGTPARVVRRTD